MSNVAVIEAPDDRFAAVLDYRTYRLRNRRATYGSSQARRMGRTAKDMGHTFGATPPFTGAQPLKVFAWLRRFVKACDDNDVSEGMALYLFPHFLAGDAEARYTLCLPDAGGHHGGESVTSYPEAVNWFLSTYAEPHTLGMAQDAFSRATLRDGETVEAFAGRLRNLSEHCGNIHSEGTLKQQLIQGLPEFLRTDAFVYNSASRSYQQMVTYAAGKYRAAKDVMAIAQRSAMGGGAGRRGPAMVGPRGGGVQLVEEDVGYPMVAAVSSASTPEPTPVTKPTPGPRDSNRGPPLCYMCWTFGHRVPDCKTLTEKQRTMVKVARALYLRRQGAKSTAADPVEARAGAIQERVATVAGVWADLFEEGDEDGGEETGATPNRRRSGNV
ncbi:hypothetical protein MMPV_004655 [Pyropia vietnamensis]